MSTKAIIGNCGFESSFIDFERGIRMGHLDPSQRITQILKVLLVERHNVDMICDRWGRGVYWQWICWVPRPNREAKPFSSGHNFGSLKFYVSAEREEKIFQAGLQIERAPKKAGENSWGVEVKKDWDWHVLLKRLKDGQLSKEVLRLLRDGFHARVGAFASMTSYESARSWDEKACLQKAQKFSPTEWGGFQIFWPFARTEIRAMSGPEIIESAFAVFEELVPVANLCMYRPCLQAA